MHIAHSAARMRQDKEQLWSCFFLKEATDRLNQKKTDKACRSTTTVTTAKQHAFNIAFSGCTEHRSTFWTLTILCHIFFVWRWHHLLALFKRLFRTISFYGRVIQPKIHWNSSAFCYFSSTAFYNLLYTHVCESHFKINANTYSLNVLCLKWSLLSLATLFVKCESCRIRKHLNCIDVCNFHRHFFRSQQK